jgi:hypothetical protein
MPRKIRRPPPLYPDALKKFVDAVRNDVTNVALRAMAELPVEPCLGIDPGKAKEKPERTAEVADTIGAEAARLAVEHMVSTGFLHALAVQARSRGGKKARDAVEKPHVPKKESHWLRVDEIIARELRVKQRVPSAEEVKEIMDLTYGYCDDGKQYVFVDDDGSEVFVKKTSFNTGLDKRIQTALKKNQKNSKK